MSLIAIVALSILGGGVLAGVGVSVAYLSARFSGGSVEMFGAIMYALWLFGPAFFGVGIAVAYYAVRLLDSKEQTWVAPLGIALAVYLLLVIAELVVVGRNRF
jgi:hypothetical protein